VGLATVRPAGGDREAARKGEPLILPALAAGCRRGPGGPWMGRVGPARSAPSYSVAGCGPIAPAWPWPDKRGTGPEPPSGDHGLREPIHQEITMDMNTTQNHDVISSDKVEGTTVYDLTGDKLGSIDDLMIDKRSGQIRYAVLEFGGFLGMGTDRYPLPWNMLKYDTEKEGYVVPLDKDRLEKAPRYSSDDRPEYTTDYGRQVNTYYGVDR
jgi:sporulation protein YlmC with PRC-barrel domain